MLGETAPVWRPCQPEQEQSAGDFAEARLIAFYLPQFHPIPENDAWWGKGFTEWIHVANARPLFPGHYQPCVPTDLGYYDLRVPETRVAQAEMAREYGIEGFCYWHYWFAGTRLLERPFNEVLESGSPDLPFCLAWANQSWTGIWHGCPDRMLIEQTYPGMDDYMAHFYTVLEAFGDERYMTINGKPVFLVYYPYGLPEPRRFTDLWRELALKVGLKGLYFIALAGPEWHCQEEGFDASVIGNPGVMLNGLGHFSMSRFDRLCQRLTNYKWGELQRRILSRPSVYAYEQAVEKALPTPREDFDQYPCIVPNWDNTPRSGLRGVVLQNSSPEKFGKHLSRAIDQVRQRELDRRVIFVKSWNEWAEGNYLEPDQRFGKAYLEVVKQRIHC